MDWQFGIAVTVLVGLLGVAGWYAFTWLRDSLTVEHYDDPVHEAEPVDGVRVLEPERPNLFTRRPDFVDGEKRGWS